MGLQLIAAIKASAPHARSVLISGARDADVQAEAAALGLDVAYGGLSQTAKAQLIRDTPRTSVWVGDGSQQSLRESIAVSTASISIAGLSSLDLDAADVLLPYDGLSTVPVLLELAQAHAHRLARDYRAVYTANLLGAAGAIVARLTSMQSGLLSNAATWLVYERHARALDQLAADYEATHDRLVHALHP
jgi:cation transport ATPase